MGRHVQAGEEAGDAAAGRRRAGVVPTSGAGLPDADQPGSAEGDERGEKEGAGVSVSRKGYGWYPQLTQSNQNNSIGTV